MADKEKIASLTAIKRFFEADGGKKVQMDELKSLSPEDRKYIGGMCAEALGCELQA